MSPRDNVEEAYQALINMSDSEWSGLIRSLMDGGVLTEIENEAFNRALDERGLK